MARRPKIHLIASRRELRALVSPARQEIVDVLEQTGSASAAELSSLLARPADALYYHLRVLCKAGLIIESESRTKSGRRRAVYRAAGERLYLDYAASRKVDSAALPSIVNGMLRLGMRDFRNAARDPSVLLSGPARELWAARRTLWLSRKDVAAVNRVIAGVRHKAKRRNARLFALTIVLVPLQRGGRRRRSKSRMEGAGD